MSEKNNSGLTVKQKKEHMTTLAKYREETLRPNPELRSLFLEITPFCNEHCLHCGSRCGDIDVKDMVSVCEADAKAKVAERTKMLDIAKENAKNTIEGLLLPLVEGQHYTIVWKDGE